MIVGFTYPAVLALLVVPIGLLAWTWRRKGREVALPFDHGNQREGRGWWRTIGVFESLPACLLAVVIFMLAGPQESGLPRSRRALTNIEFCVDNSSSMTMPFGEQSRYEASMKAIHEFVDFREGDAFGLTFFSDATLQWVPLTTDTSAFGYALPFMDPRLPLPAGLGAGTQIGKGLEECRKTLMTREHGDRMIILVSDGASADLHGGRDAEVAAALKRDGIVVIDVHVADGEVPKEIVNIAYLTDGEVFQPGDQDALAAVFKRIDEMRKAKLEKVSAETHDHFFLPSIAGLSLLGMAMLGLFGLRYTPW
jgi:Ca-activated chloride channel homolog